MINELVSQAREDTEQLDTSLILSFATKGLQLFDRVNSHLSNKRREQVLRKIGQKYTFLPNEKLENNGKKLFRQQFEQRLNVLKQLKQFQLRVFRPKASSFPKGHSLAKALVSRGCNQLQQEYTFQRSTLPTTQSI